MLLVVGYIPVGVQKEINNMSEWQETIEDGKVYWVNDEHGNVLKLADGVYIGLMPRVLKLGPFLTVEQAQRALENNKIAVDNLIENFNQEMAGLVKDKWEIEKRGNNKIWKKKRNIKY